MVKVSVNGPFQNLVTKVWTFKMSSFPDHNDACFIQRLKEATKLWQMCAAELAIKRSVDTCNFTVQCDFNVLTWTISLCDAISMYWHVRFHDAMRFQCVDMNDFTMRCDFNVLTCTISRCNAISMCWHERFHNVMRFQCVDMYNFTMQCNFNVFTWTISRCDFDVLACMISQCDLNVLTSIPR